MMHITEDTPPDMLTGAMDLTVHLPSQGRTVKMSVERSTPMMDVLVLITTQYNLQVSRYAIEALGMAPTGLEYSDRVLPYRPNTPLGALDTQHIRLIPKQKAAPPPRPTNIAGHQPFESTFRLKVHLPKNQLYVIRVSRHIYLEDIMTKVCDDKNLDPRRYEFRHPGNLDQILDSKLTLSDYQITEIYLVVKGTLTAFTTNDIMALRREEEKKQMHTKAGGGVFNLIFKKSRNSLEYGSGSSENRSVSPSHSDDSRSVTPPAQLNTALITPPKDQPKPPQRKRKPAPKPPTQQQQVVDAQPTHLQEAIITIKPSSSTEAIVEALPNNSTTNICHSRTSSDSSGYHEASILSDNLIHNSSLPRIHQRPKTIIGGHEIELRKGGMSGGIHGDHSKSMGNLMTLASKSKSTTSLMTTGRKKKAAPLPPPPSNLTSFIPSQNHHQQTQSLSIIPPVLPPPQTTAIIETTSLVLGNVVVKEVDLEKAANDMIDVASHQEAVDVVEEEKHHKSLTEASSPSQEPPKIRPRLRPPVPTPRTHCGHRRRPSTTSSNQTLNNDNDSIDTISVSTFGEDTNTSDKEICTNTELEDEDSLMAQVEEALNPILNLAEATNEPVAAAAQDNYLQAINSINIDLFSVAKDTDKPLNNFDILRGLNKPDMIDSLIESTDLTSEDDVAPPKHFQKKVEVPSSIGRHTKFDTLSRKRGFHIGSSLTSMDTTSSSMSSSTADSVSVYSNNNSSETPEEEDDLTDVNVSLFSVDNDRRFNKLPRKKTSRHELFGIHDSLGEIDTSQSVSSMDGIPGFKGIKKWNNLNSLDGISLMSSITNGFGGGDGSDTSESLSSTNLHLSESTSASLNVPSAASKVSASEEATVEWKYELPLPPTAFRDEDNEPDNLTQYDTTTNTLVSERFRGDSVVSNPELFEKLNKLKETQSDTTTTVSTEDDNKSIYNKLSLELLQKRNSLVYNREIATTLKSSPEAFKSELTEVVQQPSKLTKHQQQRETSGGLPNFKITTYDEPKSKINIYEDDTVRSNQSSDIAYKTRSLMRTTRSTNQTEDSAPAVMKTTTSSYNAPVVRSGSFSINTWSAVNPLKRSTSQAALIHRRNEEQSSIDVMLAKTTSTIDVSADNAGGLQSLGVMKLIRNSLQSPTVDTVDSKSPQEEIVRRREPPEEKPQVVKRWSPPDISLGTWSDRPKSEVIVKGDSDYKFNYKSMNSTTNTGGLVVISNNNTAQQPFISRRPITDNSNNVSIKINGSEPISSSNGTGNVTIKIGSANQQAITYRKPFGNVNRPHSIAFDDTSYNDDLSRRPLPVVTSATLKKSVTQINNNNGYTTLNNKTDRPTSVTVNVNNNQAQSTMKYTLNNHRKSWNALLNQGTLLSSSNKEQLNNSGYGYNTNINVPFSQMRLKRTDSNKILTQPTANGTEMGFGRVLESKRQQNGIVAPPPPPPLLMPTNQKVPLRQQQYTSTAEDPRSALLSAIQNFGGKKGLRTMRT